MRMAEKAEGSAEDFIQRCPTQTSLGSRLLSKNLNAGDLLVNAPGSICEGWRTTDLVEGELNNSKKSLIHFKRIGMALPDCSTLKQDSWTSVTQAVTELRLCLGRGCGLFKAMPFLGLSCRPSAAYTPGSWRNEYFHPEEGDVQYTTTSLTSNKKKKLFKSSLYRAHHIQDNDWINVHSYIYYLCCGDE